MTLKSIDFAHFQMFLNIAHLLPTHSTGGISILFIHPYLRGSPNLTHGDVPSRIIWEQKKIQNNISYSMAQQPLKDFGHPLIRVSLSNSINTKQEKKKETLTKK